MALRSWPGMLLVVILIVPRAARAGNDDELLVGNQAAMMGGAVSATIRDSSSIWYNPSGLGAIDRDQVDVSATVYSLRSYRVPKIIALIDGPADAGAVTEFVVAPAQIAYVRRLSPNLALGLGYFVPKASNFVLREGVADRRGSVTSQWQIAAAEAYTQHTGAAALGFALSPKIRLGFSLIAGYGASTESISLFGAVSRDGQAVASNGSTLIGTLSSISLQAGFGMQLELTPEVSVGITYRSPEVQIHSSYDGSINTSVTALTASGMGSLAALAAETDPPASLGLLKAGRAGLGVAYRYGKGFVSAEIDVQPGLRQSRIDVDRKAVVNARVGVHHDLSQALALGFGLFTDRAAGKPLPDSAFDDISDFYGATVGLEFSNEHKLAAEERTSSLVFSSVFALRYAHSDGDFTGVLIEPDEIANNPYDQVKSDIFIHEFGLYVGGGLGF